MNKLSKDNIGKRQLIGAIDQGTSSTRFLVFEPETGQVVGSSQIEIKRIVPKEGWVEIDPDEIIHTVNQTISDVCQQLSCEQAVEIDSKLAANYFKCIGICNQRESTVVWDSETGEPLYNVIVWMDNRTKDVVDQMIDSLPGRDFNWFKYKTGLPMSTYFSAFKLKWLIDNVDAVKLALNNNRLRFGTVDSWILWNLTEGQHLTDVTNASRTFLMNIESLEWDENICDYFKIPTKILPKILSSADNFGFIRSGPLEGLPITGVIGDQSAALFGHNCLQIGQTKATYGTGCFIMQNIGSGPLSSALKGIHPDAKRGLVTTVAYKLGTQPACYALEGSIKIAGAALTWLRDNMQIIENYEECDLLVNQTSNSAGVLFVPALGGLYSPHWDPNATGIFIGLSQFSKREHLVRATLDSIAFQTNDILSLMRGVTSGLMIDGGLCKSDNVCQILADITGCDIVRPAMCETSALGAALLAGYGSGMWSYETMVAKSRSLSNSGPEFGHLHRHHYPHESLNYEGEQRSIGLTVNIDSADGNSEIGTCLNSLAVDEELELGSSTGTSTSNSDELIVNDIDQFNRPQSDFTRASSGYSSAFENSSIVNSINQRQDSPSDCEEFMEVSENDNHKTLKRVDVFQSYISLEHRTDLVNTWNQAVERSMNWTKIHHEEIKRIDYRRLSALPISVYLFVSIGIVALSEILSIGWNHQLA